MSGLKFTLVAIVCLWLAGGCQMAVAPHVTIFGVPPDFLLIVLGCLSLFGSRRSGSAVGFGAGLVQGAISGANLWQYVVSRAITGFVTGWFGVLEFEANALVAFFAVAGGTLVAQILLMFTAPPPQLARFLLATIGSAVVNGVLAMPVFSVLKRVVDPPSK